MNAQACLGPFPSSHFKSTVQLMDGRTGGPHPSATYLIYLYVISLAPHTVAPYTRPDCATVDCEDAAPRVTRLPVLKVEV